MFNRVGYLTFYSLWSFFVFEYKRVCTSCVTNVQSGYIFLPGILEAGFHSSNLVFIRNIHIYIYLLIYIYTYTYICIYIHIYI